MSTTTKRRIITPKIKETFQESNISYDDLISKIGEIKKGHAGYLVEYEQREITDHKGLEIIGYPNPLLKQIHKAGHCVYYNNYSYAFDKQALLLTSKKNYLKSSKLVTVKVITSPNPLFGYLIRRISQFFRIGDKIYLLVIIKILQKININVLIPQTGYFIDPFGSLIIEDSYTINFNAFEETIVKTFNDNQQELFLELLDCEGDFELAKKRALLNGYVTSNSQFTELKHQLKKSLNKTLGLKLKISLEYYFLCNRSLLSKKNFKTFLDL